MTVPALLGGVGGERGQCSRRAEGGIRVLGPDVLSRQGHDLLDLVRLELRRPRQALSGDLLAPVALDQPRCSSRLPCGLGAGSSRHRHVGVSAVLRGAGVPEPRPDRQLGPGHAGKLDTQRAQERPEQRVQPAEELVQADQQLGAAGDLDPQSVGVGDRPLDHHRLVVGRGEVVTRGVQVGGDDREEDSLLVRLLEGFPREPRVGKPTDRALDDLDVVVRRVGDTLRVVVRIEHEGIPDAQRHHLALGTEPGIAAGVVGQLGCLFRPAGAVV